jgi:GR25 family glycosyltransferase involved in LPS biosynthesis
MRLNIINLPTRADRRAQFTAWNTRPGIELAFVDAVVGASVDPGYLQTQGVVSSDANAFTAGALGNALSHRALWLKAKDSAEPMIICEDDACLRGDFTVRAPAILRQLPPGWDIAFLGYNTNATVAVEGPDAIKTILLFDDTAKKAPGYFDSYAQSNAPSPTLMACFQAWGTLCYAISPKGAARLLSLCFPLNSGPDLVMFGQGRVIKPYTLDGMINVALQRQPVSAWCSYPPLALSSNDVATSDVITR